MNYDFNVAIYQSGFSILGIGNGASNLEAIQDAINDIKNNHSYDEIDFVADNIERKLDGCGIHGKIYYAVIDEFTYGCISKYGGKFDYEIEGGELRITE